MKIKHVEKPLNPRDFLELHALATNVGDFIEYWGFKRVHGKLWCYLFLAQKPLNTSQLMDLLKISKALLSQSLTELLKYRLIQETGKGKNGVTFYQANFQVSEVIASVLKNREKKMLSLVQKSHQGMSKSKLFSAHSALPISAERFETVGNWVSTALHFLDLGLAQIGTADDPFERHFLPPPTKRTAQRSLPPSK